MSRGRLFATLVLTAALAACGDPTTRPSSEQPPAATDTTPGTTVVESASETTSLATDPEPSIAVGTDDTTDAGAPPETAVPTEGVAIDDPFPPQADGLTDPSLADTAIRWAYQHWILVDLDPAVRARIVEDGEQNTVDLERRIADARGTIDRAGVEVDEVRLTGVDTADVRFRLRWQDGPSPIFPDPITGTAVFQNGSWRISGHTLCLLAFGIGRQCEPDAPPLAPEGFRVVSGIPVGFEWVGDPGFEGVMPVPGGGYWMASEEMIEEEPGGPGLSISFEVLPGSATLSDADIEVIVRARAGAGIIERVPIEIDDARGWMDARSGFTNIVLIRPDDVLVLAGGQVSATELMTILGELEPIDLPADFPRVAIDDGLVAEPPSDGLSFDI